MNRLYTLLSFCLFIQFVGLSAQTAPDFTVTDSWGNTHHLYADYLDQGKTVVIKVFYVACPPCNAIAPHLEPLYQKWGGGAADVQFIELSILQSDSDAKVNTYKSSHSTTFPASGGEGGSVTAVQPYKDGTFGTYTGTPTFVVIAPDRTVNYDVSGLNIQGTIAALDTAITATGATGVISATEDVDNKLPFTLRSNLVADVLILENPGEATELNTTIVSVSGQKYTSARFPIQKNDHINLNVSELKAGSWILQVQDLNSRLTSSYLFVKL